MTSQPGQKTITIHKLPNISPSKGNQTMKFGQLIEYNKRIFFFSNHAENVERRPVPDLFLFFKKALCEVNASGLPRNFNIFRQFSTWHTIKLNCIKLQIIDRENSILSFQKSVWEQFLHNILQMIFQEKCFSCYILLTDQSSLFDCLYFSRYWEIYVLKQFVNQAVMS